MTKVLALDLSLTRTGFAADTDQGLLLGHFCPGKVESTEKSKAERLDAFHTTVREWLREFQPDVVVIEDYSFGSRGRATFSLGELGGNVKRCIYSEGYEFTVVSPKTVKKFATGNGNADKEDVFRRAIKLASVEVYNNDQADAFFLYSMAKQYYDGVVISDSKKALEAIDSVDWPVLENTEPIPETTSASHSILLDKALGLTHE